MLLFLDQNVFFGNLQWVIHKKRRKDLCYDRFVHKNEILRPAQQNLKSTYFFGLFWKRISNIFKLLIVSRYVDRLQVDLHVRTDCMAEDHQKFKYIR